MSSGCPSTKSRSHVGRVGALAVALGIGSAVAAGLSTPLAHADTDGSSASGSGRGSVSTAASSDQSNGRSSGTRAVRAGVRQVDSAEAPSLPGITIPGMAASRRTTTDRPAAESPVALPTSPDVAPPSHPAVAVPSTDLSAAAPATLARASVTPRAEVAPAAELPRVGQNVTVAEQFVAAPPAAAVSALAPSPVAAVRVASPPIASVSVATAVGKFLASLSHVLGGSAPTAPADAALALMLSAARRETAPATGSVPAATATSSSTTPVVEAEKMTVSPVGSGRVVSDRTASGNSALALVGSGTASTTVSVSASTALTIRAKASAGAPNMTVSIDGVPVTTVVVSSTAYQDYTFAGTIAAGKHVISVSSANATALGSLYLDKVSVTAGAIGDQFSGSMNAAASGTFWSTTLGTGWDPGIQNYTNGGAVLDGQGHLVIQATRGTSGAWTSGRIETANKLSLGYGTITARIKVPKGQGLWPAFWLTGADAATNGWPATGEIDVMELPSTTTTMYSTLHGPIAGTTATQQAQIISTLPDLSTGYHNYWVRHLPNKITFGVDRQTLGTLTPADLAPGETWVYNRPMYVILNLAVGGSWAGAPDGTTPSTAQMLVDSVTFVPA